MLIAIDENIIDSLTYVLAQAKDELALLAEQKKRAEAQADRNRLFNEAEACAYLKRDADTLLYYRNHGLEHYKKGRDVWYKKGDIDDWLAAGKINRHSHKRAQQRES